MKTIYAAFLGFLLDCALGDPHRMPHPVRLIGRAIGFLEKGCRQLWKTEERPSSGRLFLAGMTTTALVLLGTVFISALTVSVACRLGEAAGIFWMGVLSYYLLAARSLCVESMQVYRALQEENLQKARQALSMIVGRDVEGLDEAGVIRACVETVAENTSDGVVAPLFFLAIGGPVAGFFYKAVNTMDSMLGYKTERYLYFGRPAARLDDICNYIPARVSALLMVSAAFLNGLDGRNAFRIYKRDRACHASPNSAQTEAACAGALRIRLAGPAFYFGKKVNKPYIGDDCRPVEREDIRRAGRLMYGTVLLALGLFCGLRWLVWRLFFG